ncbi:hypothetical protein LTR92_009699 [Exophiala xenobiotica]|nr:hypothetical protein LTR92_009699 [Exophiala xenobiotica]KAK5404730.1 hypothetical protein LTR06_009451 [Exophiala xenobiotica]
MAHVRINLDLNHPYLFWTPVAPTDSERKEQILVRHQHAARVAHQRNKARRYPSGRPKASSTSCTLKRPRQGPKGSNDVDTADTADTDVHKRRLSPRHAPGGGNRVEPFDVLCIKSLSIDAQEMFRTAIIDLWPAFAISRNQKDVDTWRSVTVNMAVETPYLLQAIIYTAASYRYFFGCRDHGTNFTRLSSYHETLRGLRDVVVHRSRSGPASENQNGRPGQPGAGSGSGSGCSDDAILLAIALLTIHGPPSGMQGRTLLGEQQLKDYEYYGSKVWAPSHLQALLSLVKQRGGLQAIGIHALSGIVFTIDTTNAVSVLEKPTFALPFPPAHFLEVLRQPRQPVNQTSSNRHKQQDREQQQQQQQPRSVCRGFRFLRKHGFPKCGRALLSIIEDVHALVDKYNPTPLCGGGGGGGGGQSLKSGGGAGVDFGQLVATWRILQHQTLSLDPVPIPASVSSEKGPVGAEAEDLLLYRLCRVAVVIYLTECLEPLPTIGAFHENCSRRLMLLIDECDKLGYWQRQRQKSGTTPELLLWATVLGGFTARGTRWLRQWYVEQLRGDGGSGSPIPIPTVQSCWDDVLALSEEKFLPFRHRQEQGCREFWDEACIYLAGCSGNNKVPYLPR